MTSQQLMLVASAVYAVLLGVTIYFTRATARRALAALAGGAAVECPGTGSTHPTDLNNPHEVVGM